MNYYKAINCFTDASITKDPVTGKYIASSGYCIVIDGMIVEHDNQILYDATNSYGELYAVLMGVRALNKYKAERRQMNILSDSRISIMGLREWIFNWVNNFNNSSGSLGLISYAGAEISNQELYTAVIDEIINNQIPLGLYHILGHVNYKSKEKIHKARTYFNKTNQESIGDDIAKELCYYNNYVDLMTRERLKDVVYAQESFNRDLYTKKMAPIIRIPMDNEMEEYKSLIS